MHHSGMQQPDIALCVAGNKSEWDRFVSAYAGLIYKAVTRTLAPAGSLYGADDVSDIVQNVFVRLVRDEFKVLRNHDPKRCALSTWLSIIAKNTALDYMRAARIEDSLEECVIEPGTDALDPARVVEPHFECPDGLLTERQEMVMRMLYRDEFEVPEVADQLGIRAQTVRSIRHQAIGRLREHNQAFAV